MKRLAQMLLFVVAVHLLRVALAGWSNDGEARLAYVAQRLDERRFGVAPGHPFDGEWKLITRSMAVLAATNLAFADPTTKATHLAQVTRWAADLASDEQRAYDTRMWGGHDALATLDAAGEGHAGYWGHVLVALGAQCVLGGGSSDQHHRLAEAMASKIASSPTGLIETYPGETYVPDNVVVMAGLALFDRCRGTAAHAPLIAWWLTQLRAQWLDPETSVLVFAPGQRSRGSGAAWNSLFLPFIDDGFADEQRHGLLAHFEQTTGFGFLRGIREWPHGREGRGDVDAGPLICGISPSATGFELGASAREQNPSRLRASLRTAELVGVTLGARYLTAPLVGDAIVVAGLSARPWQ